MKKVAWVIDDHQLFNAGLSRLLIGLDGIEKVESFASPKEVFDATKLASPCLIVADYFIPGFKIDTWVPKLRELYPESSIVVVSSSISALDRQHCLRLGAKAYFEKHLEPDAVLSGLQDVLRNNYQPKEEVTTFAERLAEDKLTQRQTEIIIRLARGSSLKAIADEIGISPETVKTHLSNLYKKLDISSKSEAIIWAREHGLV